MVGSKTGARDRGDAAGAAEVRRMTNVAVVGAQWGDEGKGKIVDWLSERAEVVVRFQGGHNAGHTLVVNGRTYKLSLLPSGVVRPGKLSIIGNGVVVDPWALLDEIEAVRGQGVAVGPDSLRIAENAPLILPLHGELDRARERARQASNSGTGTLGTTGRGIGPAYEDKIARRAIRVCDLADPKLLAAKIEDLLRHHNALRQAFGEPAIEPGELALRLNALAPRLLPYAEPVWLRLVELRRRGARILFEGAQGAMLDIDHGTYPFVTSSNTLAAAAALGAGTGADAVGFALGITKAYTTRVGEGPFPTELGDEIGRGLGEATASMHPPTWPPSRPGSRTWPTVMSSSAGPGPGPSWWCATSAPPAPPSTTSTSRTLAGDTVKRIVFWMLSTLSTVVVLFGYHTSTSSVMATGSGSAISGSVQGQSASGSSSSGSGGTPPPGSTGNGTGTGNGSSTAGSSGSSGGASGGSNASTVTGTAAQTRYGPVQVQLEVTGARVTNVTILQYPNRDGRDLQISQYALPRLIQETLDAQGSNISMVSGATYTSQGYAQSLQSALDQAGL